MSRKARLLGFVTALHLSTVLVWADPPTTQPTPQPVAQPVPAPTADVYVLPFQPLADAGPLPWAGRAVQQNLTADLARASLRPVTSDATAPDPLAAARAAGARFLVTGTYQWAAPNLRLDGQVRDVATGAVVAGLTATGDGRNLFGLEDALSIQLLRALAHAGVAPHAPTARPVPPDLQPAAVAAAIQPPAAGPGSAYDGSALQSYVDANRTPSTDYDQQVTNLRDRNTFGAYPNSGGYGFGGDGFGGYGFGGYGGGYGGYGYGGGGGLLAGVSYPVAAGIGYGGGGFGGFGRALGGFGGAFGNGGGGFRGTGGFGNSGFGGGRRR